MEQMFPLGATQYYVPTLFTGDELFRYHKAPLTKYLIMSESFFDSPLCLVKGLPRVVISSCLR